MIDDIFKPKAREQKFLESGYLKETIELEKKEFEENKIKEASENIEIINNIIDEIRENPENASKSYKRAVFKKLSEKNHQDFSNLLDETKQLKENLYKKVKESKKGYILDLTNNSELKEHANNIFGNNKSSITFEDYMTLLELKRTLEIDEMIEVSELEKV
jgi:hypothetical protein